jgi:hypothetical protein
MDSLPALERKRERRIVALLAVNGLGRWRRTVIDWLRWYDGLEGVVDSDRQGPYPETIYLLRRLTEFAGHPTDEHFAALLAHCQYLDFRVCVLDACGELGEEWPPRSQPLRQWQAGRPMGAWAALTPPVEIERVARLLLHDLRR